MMGGLPSFSTKYLCVYNCTMNAIINKHMTQLPSAVFTRDNDTQDDYYLACSRHEYVRHIYILYFSASIFTFSTSSYTSHIQAFYVASIFTFSTSSYILHIQAFDIASIFTFSTSSYISHTLAFYIASIFTFGTSSYISHLQAFSHLKVPQMSII